MFQGVSVILGTVVLIVEDALITTTVTLTAPFARRRTHATIMGLVSEQEHAFAIRDSTGPTVRCVLRVIMDTPTVNCAQERPHAMGMVTAAQPVAFATMVLWESAATLVPLAFLDTPRVLRVQETASATGMGTATRQGNVYAMLVLGDQTVAPALQTTIHTPPALTARSTARATGMETATQVGSAFAMRVSRA